MNASAPFGSDAPQSRPFYIASAVFIAAGLWLLAGFWFGFHASPVVLLVLVPLAWLAGPFVGRAARRLTAHDWLAAGLASLAALALPLLVVEGTFSGNLPPQLLAALYLLPTLLQSLALLLAAGLLIVAHALYRQWQATHEREAAWMAGAALLLGALLIARALYNLYWSTVWDGTTDPLPLWWVTLPLLAALIGGALLAASLNGWARLAGLAFALLVPAALLAMSFRAQQVDFRQLTAERAARVNQAIEAYHAHAGRYPRSLGELTPWYAPSLSEPVIIYGQHWCYQGGDDYYQLGYVSRNHWSSPILIGEVYAAAGTAPDHGGVCAGEIAALVRRAPGYSAAPPP